MQNFQKLIKTSHLTIYNIISYLIINQSTMLYWTLIHSLSNDLLCLVESQSRFFPILAQSLIKLIRVCWLTNLRTKQIMKSCHVIFLQEHHGPCWIKSKFNPCKYESKRGCKKFSFFFICILTTVTKRYTWAPTTVYMVPKRYPVKGVNTVQQQIVILLFFI